MSDIADLLVLVVVIFGLNLMPAFAPPTWMVMSWIGFSLPEANPALLALAAACAATTGRLVLAQMAFALVRQRWMREDDRRNIDVVGEWLERRKSMTVGFMLAYAFSPFPSNYLFIAYGLTGMRLWMIGLPFLQDASSATLCGRIWLRWARAIWTRILMGPISVSISFSRSCFFWRPCTSSQEWTGYVCCMSDAYVGDAHGNCLPHRDEATCVRTWPIRGACRSSKGAVQRPATDVARPAHARFCIAGATSKWSMLTCRPSCQRNRGT